jgi:hypothetical protein
MKKNHIFSATLSYFHASEQLKPYIKTAKDNSKHQLIETIKTYKTYEENHLYARPDAFSSNQSLGSNRR